MSWQTFGNIATTTAPAYRLGMAMKLCSTMSMPTNTKIGLGGMLGYIPFMAAVLPAAALPMSVEKGRAAE